MRRKLIQGVAGILVVGALAAAGASLYLRRSLPVIAGTIEVTGISGPLEIIRDRDAIPHIFASTKLDAFYGLGYVHAQDRLWQMEFQRRVGHGRLSEIFGEATLREDRFLRTVGFGRAARSAWERLPADARRQIEAYVAGVNAFISTHRGSRLPPEFSLLRFEPEPWSGPDVIAWVKMMAWDLSANYSFELLRRDIAARVGIDRMKELLPPYPAGGLNILSAARPIGGPILRSGAPPSGAPSSPSPSDPISSTPDLKVGATYTDALARSFAGGDPTLRRLMLGGGGAIEGLGSNNWVVDGTLTASGKPMLANDPHLGAQIPSVWYLAHITGGDYDVVGATLPGIPAFALGRNRSIAWGATNMFADVQDLYRERLDPTGPRAEFKGQMEPLRLLTEVISVRSAADVRLEVRISRHGPLVSDAINANNGVGPTDPAAMEPLAFRWTALEEEDQTIVAFLRLNEAHNWDEFSAALRNFVVPSQNFVYADIEGHIGYYAPGRVPIRASGDGLMPAEGWTGQAEWTGWIPFDELPHTYDPASHFVVTANNRPVPADYKYALGFEYHEPYRAQRIVDLLQKQSALTPDDFRAIQADTYSLHAQTLLPLLLRHVKPATAQENLAVELLRSWNFDASEDSVAAAIFSAWFFQLAPALVEDELGPAVIGAYARHFSFTTRFVINLLKAGSGFCDRAGTPESEPCDAVVNTALREGLNMLTDRLGGDVSHWQWEAAHRAVFPHLGLDTVTGLRWLLSRSIRNRGDWSTVNVGAVDVTRPFEQTEIAGYRQIIDFSPANDSRYLGSVGQAGHFLSPHYDDALDDWRELRHAPMEMDRDKVARGAIGRLRLVPIPAAPMSSSHEF